MDERLCEIVLHSPAHSSRWGRPILYSAIGHGVAAAFFPFLLQPPRPHSAWPVRVVEIRIIKKINASRSRPVAARRSFAPAAAGDEPAAPPRPADIPAPQPRAADASPAELQARGPLFGGPADAPPQPGRLYVSLADVTAEAPPARPAPREAPPARGGLRAQAIAGGTGLERPSEPIIQEYPREAAAEGRPPAASCGDYFAIYGALGRRRILNMRLPRYPHWAEERGIEAQVSVWLAATARGEVEPGLYILRTSGYPELDRIVLDAVRSIVFEPGSGSDSGEATFNFKLKRSAREKP